MVKSQQKERPRAVDQPEQAIGDAAPPIFKSWRALYLIVLVHLVVLIVLFYLFTRALA